MTDTATLPAPVTESSDLRQRALKDVLVQVGARIGNLALGVVVTALLARTLGDAGFGQWTTILTAFQLIGFLTSLGLDAVAVRESASDPASARTWVGALVVTRIGLTVPSMVVAFLVLLQVQEDRTMLIAGLVLLLQFPFSVLSSLQVVHQVRMRNAIPMVVLTLNSVLWAVCVLVIKLQDGGLIALAVALTAVGAVTSSVQAIAGMRLLGGRMRSSWPAVKELLRIGAPLGLAGLLVSAYARIDQIMVYKQAGAEAAGLYGAAYRILEQAHFVPMSVITTLAPLIASLWLTDRERMLRVVGLAARLLSIASFGALAFIIVAHRPVVQLIFGDEFVRGAKALPVLGAAFVFICFGYLVGNLLFVSGQVRKQVAVALIGLVVNVAGNLVLIPRYSYMGAAWMTLVTEVAVVATGGVFVLRRLGLQRVDIRPILRVLVAAATLAGVLAAVDAAGGGLAILTTVACLTYPLALVTLGAIDADDLREVLMRRQVT